MTSSSSAAYGNPDVLQLVDRTLPTPGPGEVRVQVAVPGVNPTDWQTRSGAHPGHFPEVTPHLNGAGVIDAVVPLPARPYRRRAPGSGERHGRQGPGGRHVVTLGRHPRTASHP
ncbi:alcohol dehydrogenase catalytic domain-containing protein [Nonomuraea sp. 10N515B]|uniref:alcohol dehydrogenase catalytic domain-containing protein n=1 Tax=Nonomuraea sp. 10N515B TaxID=3457422 RepID=UPI003FCD3F14